MGIHTTKTGKPLINRITGLPIYSNTVEARIKRARAELNQGLSKHDAIWNNICTTAKMNLQIY